jgi:cell fate regulator YaaT (PSP1 superfamily)
MSTPLNIVGIRFQRVGKVYHFDAAHYQDLRVGDQVVVETSRGMQLGEVAEVVENPTSPPEGGWKSIHHIATPRDLVMRQLLQKKELEAMINCREKLAELKTPGVKIVGAEYTFDASRLSFLYSTEAEGKIELRDLRNAMQRIYPRARVEMRQVGPRDVAKMLGGMGACGIDSRCCSRFLTDFSPISIKMAKEQGISLTPSEITGMCGRLRCCLIYEYEQYVEARKNLPKRGKRVETAKGEGKVVDVYPLRQGVVVLLDTGVQQEFPHDQIQPWDELEALRRKSQQPCSEHENGVCTCGKEQPASSEPAWQEPAPKIEPPRAAAPPSRKKKKKKGPRGPGGRSAGNQPL